MKQICLLLIEFYQRIISPRKGFKCAHHALHRGPTCSNAVKSLIEEHGHGHKSRHDLKPAESHTKLFSIRQHRGQDLTFLAIYPAMFLLPIVAQAMEAQEVEAAHLATY